MESTLDRIFFDDAMSGLHVSLRLENWERRPGYGEIFPKKILNCLQDDDNPLNMPSCQREYLQTSPCIMNPEFLDDSSIVNIFSTSL